MSRSGDRWRRRVAKPVLVLAAAVATLLLSPGTGSAHDEREVTFPDGSGSVPEVREDGPQLLVCKDDPVDFAQRVAGFDAPLRERNLALFDTCLDRGYRHLQQAVDAATAGSIIRVLPGVYHEEPSLTRPSPECTAIDAPHGGGQDHYQILSFDQQVACRHEQNLVAVLGKRDLQIEGTGADPTDVLIDARYRKLNAIRVDRSDGFYLRNLTAQRTTFNAVYVMETDGFAIDSVVARWNVEYGFLLFANDHGRLSNCEGYGNGDAAIYPGSASNINASAGHDVARYAVEITGCYAHHNLLGYSGTAGNSVWAHGNVFTQNGAGVAMDSAFPDHPGMPQNHARFEDNVIGDNNQDYYRHVRDGTCALPPEQRGYEDGVVCPVVGLPAGTGVINPGGNYNIFQENWVYGHTYAGFVTSWAPGFVRGATGMAEQFDTSHHNRYLDNRFGLTPDGTARPNRLDVWWDGQGRGSCWHHAGPVRSEPLALPVCGADQLPAGAPIGRYLAEPAKLFKLYVCAEYTMTPEGMPASCDWYGATGLERIEVRAALAEATLLAVALLVVWAWPLRRDRLAFAALLVALAGLVVGVIGAEYEASPLPPLGLAVFGAGTAGFGLAAVRRGGAHGVAGGVAGTADPGTADPGVADPGTAGADPADAGVADPGGGRGLRWFGWLTVGLGAVALLGAVDRGLTMIPLLPVPPSLLRLLVELVWLPWAAVLLGLTLRGAPADRATGVTGAWQA